MKYGKALEEVWEWRARLAKKLEGMSSKEQVNYINENAKKACEKYGIPYKIANKKRVAA